MLIVEAKNTIRRNSGVITVYTFAHVDFEGVDCYAASEYICLKKDVIEEDFFVSEEEEKYDDVLPV